MSDNLISRQAALTALKRDKEYDKDIPNRADGVRDAIITISALPTVDAVRVVRCKNCRWGREVCGNIECFADSNIPPEYHGYEWFCPNGERKTDE